LCLIHDKDNVWRWVDAFAVKVTNTVPCFAAIAMAVPNRRELLSLGTSRHPARSEFK
jgi:hypothetical protein